MQKTVGVYYLTDGLDVLYVGKSVDVDHLECEAIKRYDPPFNTIYRKQ